MVTIATHNGTAVSREHNLRNPKIVDKEDHIIKNGLHETWKDEPIQNAYQRLFGEAVEKFNSKQKRDDRKILNYLKKIKEDKKKHIVYEIIVGVYDKTLSTEEKKAILQEYIKNWSKRNPNLEVVGVYFHADEEGEPHLHIDYIPVARGCTRGMETQNSLSKALNQQGIFGGKSPKETPQILWERAENSALEAICVSHGLEVDHPQRGKGTKHMETEIYKLTQQKKDLVAEIELNQIINANLEEDYEKLQRKVDKVEAEYSQKLEKSKSLDEVSKKVDDLQQKCDDLQKSYIKKLDKVQSLDDEISKLAEQKEIVSKSYEFNDFKEFIAKKFNQKIAEPIIYAVNLYLQETEKMLQKVTKELQEMQQKRKNTIIKEKDDKKRQLSTDFDK